RQKDKKYKNTCYTSDELIKIAEKLKFTTDPRFQLIIKSKVDEVEKKNMIINYFKTKLKDYHDYEFIQYLPHNEAVLIFKMIGTSHPEKWLANFHIDYVLYRFSKDNPTLKCFKTTSM